MFLKIIARYGFGYEKSSMRIKNVNMKENLFNPKYNISENEWQQLIKYCEFGIQKTIKSIIKPQLTNLELNSLNQKILSCVDFHKKQQLKSYDLAVMAIALKQTKYNEIKMLKSRALDLFLHYANDQTAFQGSLTNFRKKQFTNNQNIQPQMLSPQLIEFLLIEICHQFINQWKVEKDKNKKNKYKLRLLTLLKWMCSYINKMNGFQYMFYILTQFTIDANMFNKFRLSKIVDILEQRFRKFLIQKPQLAKNLKWKYDQHNQLSTSMFINILKCLQFSQYDTTEAERFYIKIICAKDFFSPNTVFYAIIRCKFTFYKHLCHYVDENNKNPVLQDIKNLYYSSNEAKQSIKNYEGVFKMFFVMNLIKSKFYHHYLQIPTTLVDGHIIITDLPPRPELDKFELQMLKDVEQNLFQEQNPFVGVILAIYPDFFKKGRNFNKMIDQKYNTVRGNEHAFRIGESIKELGVPYQKQVKVIGKRVDFLLENKIIIECDGDIHLDFKRLDVGYNTAWRNMAVLYGGYKLISINICDLNENRFCDKLRQLIEKKISIMNNHKALMVD